MIRLKPVALLIIGIAALSACTNEDTASPAETHSVAAFDAARVDSFLDSAIENNRTVGISALVYVGGKEVYFGARGFADRESNTPMSRDTLVNIYSMTKPVTGVTLMTLYEDGLFDLDDPLSDYLPAFADPQVFNGVDADGAFIVEPAARPITIIDLMRHTAGFGYGWEGNPLAEAMAARNLFSEPSTLETLADEVSSLPLFFQPGTQWQYSVSADVQARLAEVISGQPYDHLVHERVLSPLGMNDSGYHVPNDQKSRVSAVYNKTGEGILERQPDEQVYGFWPEKPSLIPGGHGLVSTIDDYMTFALMLQNEGTYGDVQVLEPETVALMATDHLPEDLVDRSWLPYKGNVGFGLNVAVREQPQLSDEENAGSVGEFFWDGSASTLFWVDPARDVTVVFFTQVMPTDNSLHHDIRAAVYEALADSEHLESQ